MPRPRAPWYRVAAREEACRAFSDGLRLRRESFLPEDAAAGGTRALVVACSGSTGLMDFHPTRVARALTRHGITRFGFDYGGLGESEATPGRVILEEQVRDVQHAAAYAASDERVDDTRILLPGWGMGAGLVIDAGRHPPGRARAHLPERLLLGPAARRGQSHRGRDGAPLRGDQGRAATAGHDRRAHLGRSVLVHMLDDTSRGDVDAILRGAPGYDGGRYSFELADSLPTWEPDAHAPAYRIPSSSGWRAGNTEWMLDENETFQAPCLKIAAWVAECPREPRVVGHTAAVRQGSRRAVSSTREHWATGAAGD